MKRMNLIAACALMILGSSCNKSYQCECTLPFSGMKEYPEVKAPNSSKAESRCKALDQTGPATDGRFDCHIVN